VTETAVLLSALHEQIRSLSPDILECEVFLASPDSVEGDGIDVYVTRIGDVDIDRDKHEITLIPVSGNEPSDTGMPILLLSILLEQLPFDEELWGDFEILTEMPLDQDSLGPVLKSLASVTSLHVGQASGEAWFLVRPASEYINDVLPS
jgi:hypothetical protein